MSEKGISIDADSGPLSSAVVVEVEKYLLFFQIGSGHTVVYFLCHRLYFNKKYFLFNSKINIEFQK